MKHPFTNEKIPLLVKQINGFQSTLFTQRLVSETLPFSFSLKMNFLKVVHTVIYNVSGILQRTPEIELSESRHPLKIIS